VGLVNASSAPGGSPDEQVAQGWTEIGTGVAILGGALWLWNVQDNVTVGEHPGAVRQWATP
jgi:hypothetical protein